MSDRLADLVDGAIRGDSSHMGALIEAWWPEAYRIAFGILRDRALAQDAAQDACATTYRHIGALRSVGSYRAWLYRVVVRCAQETARKQPHVDALVETLVSKAATAPDIEESLDVGAALGRLPHDMRVLVLLRYYANLTSREIGSVMGIPSATVRFRLAIARRQLKKLLDASTASTPISDEVRTRA